MNMFDTYKILLIDDDENLTELLVEYLESEGLNADSLNKVEPDRASLQEHINHYDLVVLDIMMPKVSGLDILKEVRLFSNIPVIMLTGKGDDLDKIIGLELGADDYLGKPCNPRELSARIKAVLRRIAGSQSAVETSESVEVNGISIDVKSLKATYLEEEIVLTGVEFSLLYELMIKAGNVLSKEQLTEDVLQRKMTLYDRSLDVHISRLRHKLNEAGLSKDVIKTVRGSGYQMVF